MVMLPTKKAENCLILKQSIGKKKLTYTEEFFTQAYLHESYAESFHLYATEEEIKEGYEGWVIVTVKDDTRIKYLAKVTASGKDVCYCDGDRKFSYELYSVKPIIATTDDTLENVPTLEKSFIDKYIDEYNKGNTPSFVRKEDTFEIIKSSYTREEVEILIGKVVKPFLWYTNEPNKETWVRDWIEENL